MKKIIWAFFITVNLIVVLFSFAYAADTEIVTVSATVLSKNNCKFNSATAALAFGTLESANPVDKTVSTTITFRCAGKDLNATFFISDDDGLYETGPNANRMMHTTVGTEFIPYTFTLNPISGTVPKNSTQTLTITGTVNGVAYQDAAAGNYSDRVIITLEP